MRSEETVPSAEEIEKVVGNLFDPEALPKPRHPYSWGDNPYKAYLLQHDHQAEKGFVPGKARWFDVSSLENRKIFPGWWLRLVTQSGGEGATYTLHIMEKAGEEDELIAIGTRERGLELEYIVGRFKRPEIGKRIVFSEYAHAPTTDELYKVGYLSEDDLRQIIRKDVVLAYEKYGSAWKTMSRPGIRVAPHGTQIRYQSTTPVTQMEVGIVFST